MQTKFIILLLLNLPFFQLFGQSTIKGTVVDMQNQPIEVGNWLVLSAADSSLIAGDLFFDGKIDVSIDLSEPALLVLTALGFENNVQLIDNQLNEIFNLNKIQLKSADLKTVTVTAFRPIFKQKGDDLSVDVANSTLSASGNAMDVLLKSPGINRNAAGTIEVIGRGNALIYVDGRLVPSPQVLEGLSSADIQSVEIIKNPSAKYDAAGKAVINIITKRKTAEGYKIGLLQEVQKNTFWTSYTKATASILTPKLLLEGGYGLKRQNGQFTFDYERKYTQDDDNFQLDNDIASTWHHWIHDYYLRTSFQLKNGGTLGAQYSGTFRDSERVADNANIFLENETPILNIKTDLSAPYTNQSHLGNLSYEKQLDTLGSNLSISGQYSTFNFDGVEKITQDITDENNTNVFKKRGSTNNEISILSGKFDYQKSLKNGWKWESGTKYTAIKNDSEIVYRDLDEEGNFTDDLLLTNANHYTEKIIAGYSQISLNIKGWAATAGLRGEYTDIEGQADREGSFDLGRSYFDLFPSVNLSKEIAKNTRLNLNYNYRIERPNFQSLNPFVIYVDSLSYFRGNPMLVPEYTHTFSSTISHKKVSLNLSFLRTLDDMNILIERDPVNPEIFTLTPKNLIRTDLWAASLTVPLSKKWWSAYNVFNLEYSTNRFVNDGEIEGHKIPTFSLFSRHTFKLGGGILMDLSFYFQTEKLDGIYIDSPLGSVSFGLKKSFLDNRLMVQLLGNDIFNTYTFKGSGNFDRYDYKYHSKYDIRFFKLAISYNFGANQMKKVGAKNIANEELMRVNRS